MWVGANKLSVVTDANVQIPVKNYEPWVDIAAMEKKLGPEWSVGSFGPLYEYVVKLVNV